MGGLANIVVRVVIMSALAAALGGCGYRELKAPCGPDEGQPAAAASALAYAPVTSPPMTGSPLDRLAVASIPVADPCGPLRPINGGRTIVPGPAGGEPP
ncbi:MAG: hypothetical protein ACRCUE_05440 [Bosea sp. (in: a-proteobacteria)]